MDASVGLQQKAEKASLQRQLLGPEEIRELIKLGAINPELFYRSFFPRTVRQSSPPFHRRIDELLDGTDRLVNIQVFRGGAKTTKLRLYTARRIAYGLAHTILYIGKSEGHATRSINWLRRQIDHNTAFSHTFELRAGSKWQDIEAEIWHGVDDYPVWIMGMGITGSVRGINRDDFRPDLIVLDDVLDEENSATPEQRKKLSDLIYGAVKESLSPASEAPDAKMVMLQTPQHKEDPSTLALGDPEWTSARFPCWTEETMDLPVHQQISSWEERYPTPVLRKEKENAAAGNRLSIFIREKECRLVAPETSAFKLEWLRYYDLPPSERMHCVLVIDPVPPPSDTQIAKGLHNKDFEAIAVVGRYKDDIYLLDYQLRRGHEPDWTINTFFQLAMKWRPFRVLIETTAYQKTLSWLLKQAMEWQRKWWPIIEYDDKISKFHKIIDGLNGVSSSGHFYIHPSHTDFITQFTDYPDVSHDDLIEAVAIGAKELQNSGYFSALEDEMRYEEEEIPALDWQPGAP